MKEIREQRRSVSKNCLKGGEWLRIIPDPPFGMKIRRRMTLPLEYASTP